MSTEPTPERYWVLTEYTYDPRREIGSMSALRVEKSRGYEYNPADRIEELEAEVDRLREGWVEAGKRLGRRWGDKS